MQQHDQDAGAYANGAVGERADILARQKRFALVLTGDERAAQDLVERHALREDGRSDGSISASALQFIAFKNLYDLWTNDGQKSSLPTSLFQPGQENQAVQQGLDPAIARIMGEMPSLHRALLLLIYGENFSYAATAQLFNITIEQLMSALAAARQNFTPQEKSSDPASRPQGSTAEFEGSHDTAL